MVNPGKVAVLVALAACGAPSPRPDPPVGTFAGERIPNQTHCRIVIRGELVSVDGTWTTHDFAVPRCKAEMAVVELSPDSDEPTWRKLRAALELAGVLVILKLQAGCDPRTTTSCRASTP